jgi:hypothetical protein
VSHPVMVIHGVGVVAVGVEVALEAGLVGGVVRILPQHLHALRAACPAGAVQDGVLVLCSLRGVRV